MAIVISAFVLGCTPSRQPKTLTGGDSFEEGSNGLALACERAIARLDSLLAESKDDPHKLIEVRELRKAAADLYLDGEYGLALEFVDEALSILGKGS